MSYGLCSSNNITILRANFYSIDKIRAKGIDNLATLDAMVRGESKRHFCAMSHNEAERVVDYFHLTAYEFHSKPRTKPVDTSRTCFGDNPADECNTKYKDPELNEIKDVNPDYIFERDVVVHQTDPFAFLKQICLSAKKGVFFRLRTRDKGSTVLDVEKSCQMYHGLWAPYIMLNCDEVVSFLADLNICSKIVILKNYAILGGHHGRYLPKDCYLDETGTAESGVYIEIDQGSKRPEIIIEKKDENERIPFLYKFLKRVIQHSFGPKSSRVWW